MASLGPFLVELERLEGIGSPGIFDIERISLGATGPLLTLKNGRTICFSANIGDEYAVLALRRFAEEGRFVYERANDSAENEVDAHWAELHYALGAYEELILADAGVQILDVQREGSVASIKIRRAPDSVELYRVSLSDEIDMGLADSIVFRRDID